MPARLTVRSVYLLILITHMLAIWQMLGQASLLGVNIWFSKWTILMALMLATLVLCSIALFLLETNSLPLLIIDSLPRWLGGILIMGAPIIFLVVKWMEFGEWLPAIYPTLWLLIWCVAIFTIGLRIASIKSWSEAGLVATLAFGVLMRLMDLIPDISTMPFSLGWSEASRYYYASLLFSQRLYGLDLPLSVLHPTRYILQAIPFIISGLPLYVHRLWQVLLWAVFTLLAAWVLVRRLKLRGLLGLSVAAWFFLYLLQGAVYYHLLVCVIIVLAGFSPRHFWRSLFIIMLASFWAGMSRVNWFPLPAMLAIALYLLERPYEKKAGYQYWVAPAVWFAIGVGTAFAGQLLYVQWSGNANNANQFASSLTSNLLWYRLFPNPTYPLGIIVGTLIVSLPLIILVWYALAERWRHWHPFRLTGLLLILLMFLGGGLIVSIKIGGGGDLHNMDAYLALLGVITPSLLFSHAVQDAPSAGKKLPLTLCYFAVLVPVFFAFEKLPITPFPQYDVTAVQDALSIVSDNVHQAANKSDQDVLFITQRQLLIFGYVEKVPLVPDYEVVTLMEMAMSDNETYLGRFYTDLKEHHFSLIVADIQNLSPSDESGKSFKEEDLVWDNRVGRFLLCYYEPVYVNVPLNLSLLMPREQPSTCP